MQTNVQSVDTDIIRKIIKNRLVGGTMQLHDSFRDVVHYINHRTPTAYGAVAFEEKGTPCAIDIQDILIKKTILNLIGEIQGDNNSSVKTTRILDDFIKDGETHLKTLQGGSAGKILLIRRDSTDELFIRKVAARIGVEGNGTPKLHAEIGFLRKLMESDQHAKLLSLYPRILDHSMEGEFITLDQEYIGDGKNVFTLLSENTITADKHHMFFDSLLDALISSGYSLGLRKVATETSFDQLEDYYLRRAEGRIRFLINCDDFEMDFPAESLAKLSQLVDKRSITINDRVYDHPLSIIDKIRANEALIEILRPRSEGFCAHGDMTLLNMVFDTANQAYRPIDNRGHFGAWDPLYDFGKLKFTLSGFGKIMNREFVLSQDMRGFTLAMTGDIQGMNELDRINEQFLSKVSSNAHFKVLAENEPYWKERILFAEAMHYLADIPHRLLLDQSPKHAVAAFLLGTIYINDLYDSLTA